MRKNPPPQDEAWHIYGIKPVYRRAVRYLKTAEGITVGGIVNRALKFYLSERWPDVLERARIDHREGRPLVGYTIGNNANDVPRDDED